MSEHVHCLCTVVVKIHSEGDIHSADTGKITSARKCCECGAIVY